MRRFTRFACIDWSGARGERQKGIAVAQCEAGDAAPVLVVMPGGWWREAVLGWLLDQAEQGADLIVGIDCSPSLPFIAGEGFFPGWATAPRTARELWRFVDALCARDPHLAATSFLEHPQASAYFRHGGRTGARFGTGLGRLREVERRCDANPASCFNLVGAKQVGKSALTAMRLLHRLDGRIAAWPFDDVPATGPLIVEIYTSIAAYAAGRPRNRSKMVDGAALDTALAALGSRPHAPLACYDDHSTDAILTAAWLRIAAPREELWRPEGMAPVRHTEGWTFGVA